MWFGLHFDRLEISIRSIYRAIAAFHTRYFVTKINQVIDPRFLPFLANNIIFIVLSSVLAVQLAF